MEKIIKLILLATALSVLLGYPVGNLLIILPTTPLLSPLNYIQSWGIDAHFVMGFMIAIIVLKLLDIPERYPFGAGFVFLILGFFAYVLFQIYKLDISMYAFNHREENRYNIKYLIEFIIFLLNIIGLILIYRSNPPDFIASDDQHRPDE